MKQFFISLLVFSLYHLLYFTWRIRIIESSTLKKDLSEKKSFIFSVWHGNELATLYLPKHYKLTALVSKSRDGQIMTNILSWMGVKVSRGSSSRGAVSGLKNLIRQTRKGLGCIFAVDGPKGPYHIIKAGVFEAAKLTKSNIYPSGVAISSYWRLNKSWNKACLPKPFAKIVIVWGESFDCDLQSANLKTPDLGNELKLRMHDAEQEALHLLAQV